jgi:cytochrome c oxidase subunit III
MSGDGFIAGGRNVRDVPRTAKAVGGPGVARAIALRRGRPAAWWGMIMLIASEATVLIAMSASYWYLRFSTTATWPPSGIPEPAWIAPAVLTAVLVASSVPMQLASVSANAGRVVRTRAFLLSALLLQVVYLAYQLPDYRDQLRRLPISTDAYTSIYYTLLGADHVHVVLGVLFNVWLLAKLARGVTTYRANATLAIAWYWHFVNVATILITATLLSPRL